jgi:two-component system aerobic respiration control sensor histidine kinase ArcB
VLLDIQLPDMTGIDIARQWREQYEASEIDYLPLLVALTANVIQSKEQYQVLGMDDVLRKPLSLEALSNCLNNYFGDSDEFMQNFAENAPLATDNVENEAQPAPFDKAMLRELLQVMDKKSLLENIALFENVMPSYLDELNGSLVQWQQSEAENDKKAVMDYAHKIKGAFASVRLSRLQEIAQQAQSEGTDWNDCIESWVSQINDDWQSDLAQARAWIEQQ